MFKANLTRRGFLKGAAAAVVAAPHILAGAARGEEAGKALFNGKDLTGWDGDPRLWSVQDGAITGQTTAENPILKGTGNTFLIWQGGTLKNFELRVRFRLESRNSGVQYRSTRREKDSNKWVVTGYQADMDEANTYTGMLYEEGGRGIVCKPGQKVVLPPDGKPQVVGVTTEPAAIKAAVKVKDWNEIVITAQGNRLVHKVNGLVTADITDDDEKKRAMEGILALQLHAGDPMKVQFKDILLKAL